MNGGHAPEHGVWCLALKSMVDVGETISGEGIGKIGGTRPSVVFDVGEYVRHSHWR